MRTFLIIVSFFLTSSQCNAQKLDGEWKGLFFDRYTNESYPIKLYFVSDSWDTYKVYSYSKGKDRNGNDTTIVCKVFYKVIWKDSICLEEAKVLLPKKADEACLQKMFLKIKKRESGLILEGTWKIASKKCNDDSGTISLTKQ